MLSLDKQTHQYTLDGTPLPSVTQIVTSVVGSPNADDYYLQRGRVLHKAIALALTGRLDRSTVDPRIAGRLAQAEKAVAELAISNPIVEVMLAHPLYKYAGTADLYADGLLVDWKSSDDRRAEIQVGGYVLLLEADKKPVKRCAAIVLDDDRYTVHWYKPPRASRLFLAALTLYAWKEET